MNNLGNGKIVAILKKILKVILWVIISVVLLFIGIAVLIQIPAIQTKIVQTAISYVSNKTHSKVEIKKISISFPKSVVIQGLYLEDITKDTLLYAGKLKVNIAFKDLFNNKIHIRSVVLEDVNLSINRPETDSVFNYNFLLTAFSDTSQQQKKTEVKTTAKWTFSIDNVNLKNIHFKYIDNYGGSNFTADLIDLKLKTNQIDFQKSIYNIDELFIDGVTSKVLIKKSLKKEEVKSNSVLPKIMVNNLQINNTNFSFLDSLDKQSLTAKINRFKLKNAIVDLQKQMLTLDNIYLSKSKIEFNTNNSRIVNDSTVDANNTAIVKNNWIVSVKGIDIEENAMFYQLVNEPTIKNAFDVNHMDYKHITLKAHDFYYSSDKTTVSIEKFTAVDHNNFSVKEFETDFRMDQYSITAKNLKIKTNNSSIDADLNIRYPSLKSLKDSFPFMELNLDLKNLSIQNSNILYFSPGLIKQVFFKNAMNITTVSGNISGRLNNLKGKKLLIHTGVSTMIASDFLIKGLPDIQKAYFDFPNLKINTAKQDIAMIAASSIPKSIELPENINLQLIFKGQIKAFETLLDINTSYGAAKLIASSDKNENFTSKIVISDFDLGSLLKNKTMYGPLSLTAEVKGHGFDKKTINASIKAEVSKMFLNKYTYHKINIDGRIKGQEFTGKINLKDENAKFDFEGLVNLNPGQENFKFLFNLEGADLQKLNFTKDDVRIGLTASADLKGGTLNSINGKAGLTNIIVVNAGKKYIIDSLLIATINKNNKTELNLSSALIGIKYKGTVSLVDLPKELSRFINNYFRFSDTTQLKVKDEMKNFNFEIQLHNHPILSEVLLPQLKEFEPGLIQGSYNSEKNGLKITAKMGKIVYGSNEIRDLSIDVNSDSNALNYKIFSNKISNAQIKFDNFSVNGKLADQTIFTTVSSIDEKQYKKLLIRSQITRNHGNYKLTLDPNDFYLMNNRWNIANDNYIEIGNKGFLIYHLFINKSESQINISSLHNQFNDDLNIEVKNFKLSDISGIFEKDSSFIRGMLSGNILLKRVNNTYGVIADAAINNLYVQEKAIGDLTLKAENPSTEKFDIDLKLSGSDNNLTAKGYYFPKGGDHSINIKIDIQSLSLKTVEAFSMGSITAASGNLSGNFLVEGQTAAPDVTGELIFNNANVTLAALNNLLFLKHERIQLKKDGIYFNSFTLLDADQHTAIIDGSVKMQNFKNFVFALHLNTKDFLLLNTSSKDNNEFYGRMIIDSKMNINGPLAFPLIDAKLKMKKGSNFTFTVPESKVNIDKGEDVVEFEDLLKYSPILSGGNKKEIQKSGITGFDISSIIEIDKQATLRLLMDPSSSDSLVVKGEAALSFSIDRSGKMSLTGSYNLNDGSYLVSLESVIKKRFAIESGSTIIWNGDPLDADVSINAIYTVRASPYDLLADEMTGLNPVEKGGYKQAYPFLVILKLRGEILHPQISFEIQLSPENKGILGGAVNTKLNMLNDDPSALNKQVFALLVLGRFIQENPLQSESNGTVSAIRTTVGNFLSAQLNQLSSKFVPGVELNFDIQSYDDYQSGQAEGRTQIDIGIKKQLFNERLSVKVGGTVDVEGEKAKQNSANDIAGDVTLEYILTKDGRFRLKAFRQNQYEGAIEGQLIETGVGILYIREFNNWRELFISPNSKNNSLKYKK
jgi:hypothetical protein